jgi:hypothetical protein
MNDLEGSMFEPTLSEPLSFTFIATPPSQARGQCLG